MCKQKLESLNNRRKQIEEEQVKYNNKLEILRNKHIEKYKTINDLENIKNNILEHENDILETENKKEEHSKNLIQIEKYNKYIQENEKYFRIQ
jgi:predicted  nucleic acid-binding Zn-ribbon protein